MKKMMMVLVPILLIGLVFGLAFLGVIDIPGISPKKKPKTAVAKVEPPKKTAPPKKKEPPKVVGDPQKGYAAVAKLWNELETETVLPLLDKWKDNELAEIFMKMDSDKVTAILTKVKADRAAKLTRAIQKLAESQA